MSGFRRTVVGLSEVSEQPRGRAGVDNASISLLAHQTKRRLRDVERSLEVNVQYLVDQRGVHFVKRPVAQDAGIVDQYVDAAKRVEGTLHNRRATFCGGDTVVVRCRNATEGDDLLDDPLRGRRRRSTTVECAPEVVHQDAGSPVSEHERVGAPEAAAGPGDDRDSSVKSQFFHGYLPVRRSLRM